MAGTGSSMLYSFLTFTVILSLQEMYRGKLASSELFTILGGFISSLLFLVSLTNNTETFVALVMLLISFFSASVHWKFPGSEWHEDWMGCRYEIPSPIYAWCSFLACPCAYVNRFLKPSFLLAEAIALTAASTVHRVCITTCFLFSAGILYEVNKLSGMTLTKSESKTKRH
ncbi:hypothetical protein EZV62_022195 [Acer yangbiense]|uniref:Uncharacterized protein n=1 Tax=Acer yangbiense TaxID=1000413 RepID=A0A5C7HA06_9ROSI|nr:hypothetical protein EZV62_022195 [Acer yangbiense]